MEFHKFVSFIRGMVMSDTRFTWNSPGRTLSAVEQGEKPCCVAITSTRSQLRCLL